jgi:hypothetical protein
LQLRCSETLAAQGHQCAGEADSRSTQQCMSCWPHPHLSLSEWCTLTSTSASCTKNRTRNPTVGARKP